jgi:PhnB protein
MSKNQFNQENKMARVSTYLNFPCNTEEAFNFYRSVFGGEFQGGISRFKDIPPSDEMPPLAEADKNLVMHVALPKETNRLFKALSAGGQVEMELQDMFWGGYYGSCKDKYGVQWMFNCTEKDK